MSDSYIFGTKPNGVVPTYEQLQMRRKIATAMLGQNRPYPKTLGEGLTSFGQNIGDIAYMRSLNEADAAKATSDAALMKATEAPSVKSPLDANDQMDDSETPPPQQLPPVGGAAPVAAATPPPPADDATRNNIASVVAAQQPGAPPTAPNPLDAYAQMQDATQPPPAAVPSAPPAPAATAITPAPAPVQAITKAPMLGLRAPTSAPIAPVRPDPTPQMRAIEAAMSQIGDPNMRSVLQERLHQAQQDQEKVWQQQTEQYQHLRGAYEGAPKAAADLTAAQKQADIAGRYGGAAAYDKFLGDTSTSYGATRQVANTMPMIQQAQQALASSYVGTGADVKLDAAKMMRMLGVPGNYNQAQATEMLKSRMQAIAAGMIKSVVGSQNISDADVNFVKAASTGDISMEPESLHRLLKAVEETNIRTVNQHNDRLLSVASDPVEDRAIRNQYRVPMLYGDDAIAKLKANPTPQMMDFFDKKFGKGHAAAVLGGRPYGE